MAYDRTEAAVQRVLDEVRFLDPEDVKAVLRRALAIAEDAARRYEDAMRVGPY